MIRAVAGLGVFKLNAVGVEGLAGDDSHAVVVVHIQIGFVHLCDPLHGHGPFAGGDSEAKRLLQIFIDGMLCDFGGQSRHQFFQKVIVIQDQRDIIQIPEPLQVVELGSHACGLTLANGLELLIHVGINTVDMNGDGFELFVDEGQKVRAGDPLIQFDPEKIRAAGHPLTTMLIVTGEGDAKNVAMHSGIEAKAAETTVITYE